MAQPLGTLSWDGGHVCCKAEGHLLKTVEEGKLFTLVFERKPVVRAMIHVLETPKWFFNLNIGLL